MSDSDYSYVSSLSLAHLGDAVFELMVRTYFIKQGTGDVTDLHKKTVSAVNAASQAQMAKILVPNLNEDELAVFKRGKNAKINTLPKNSSLADYHAATALETLFGYLWLKNRTDRLDYLFTLILESINGV